MKLFQKHNQHDPTKDITASRIANTILKMQSGFAKYMHSVTKGWNQKHKWMFLIVMSFIFSGLSLLAIVAPVRESKNEINVLPVLITPLENIPNRNDQFIITEKEVQKIKEYKANHPNLQYENPPLFDSLILVEEVYYTQKNTK